MAKEQMFSRLPVANGLQTLPYALGCPLGFVVKIMGRALGSAHRNQMRKISHNVPTICSPLFLNYNIYLSNNVFL